jgi:quinohemoprotein ethanol dehydrogenase
MPFQTLSQRLIQSCAISALMFSAQTVHAADALPAAPAFTADELITSPAENWITNGGNAWNQRYSTLDQVNRDNVAGMKAEWQTHLNSGLKPQNSAQGQILEYEGVLYIVTGDNDVFALDVESGAILWDYKANLDPANVRVCCGWTNRGLAMGDGKLFFGRLDAQLMALDQQTGEVLWSVQDADPALGYSLTAAPLYYEGMVIIGYVGGDLGIRGRISAYDADDGKQLWTFHTIPGPGEIGHDTWPQDNDVWKYGGAPVWNTPAVDPELDMIYFTTGNAYPTFNGGVRPGDNLFTASILALDAHSGEYRWHFQEIRHDIWDYDSPNPVILFDAEFDGVLRKGIAQVPKTGYLYVLDRETGAPLHPIEDVPVPQVPGRATAATQPIPVGDEILPHTIDMAPEGWPLVNEGRTFTPLPMEGSVIYRPLSHVNWHPSSYDPQSHLMFICATDQIGALVARSTNSAPEYVPYEHTDTFGSTNIPRRGILVAADLTTHQVAWRQQWADRCFSGSTVTAGGLLFIGRNDGRLTALNSSTGESLWSFRTGTGIHQSPTVFEHNGVQYIAAFAGGTIYAPSNKPGDSIWLFSLQGELGEVEPQAPASARLTPAQLLARLPAGNADLDAGKLLYTQTCMPCHGESGRGGEGGGAPLTSALTLESIVETLTYGRNNMPPFEAVLEPAKVRDVAHYVRDVLVME